MSRQINVETIMTCQFIEYTGEPGTRPPFFTPNDDELFGAPLPHSLDGRDCRFLLIPAGKEFPVEYFFMCYYDPDFPEEFEWYSSMPIYADGEFDDEEIQGIAAGVEVTDDGYLSIPLKRVIVGPFFLAA